MDVYKNEFGEIFFSNDYVYEPEFNGYIHEDDVKEFYLDDASADIEVCELQDAQSQMTIIDWAEQNGHPIKSSKTLDLYMSELE